MIDNFINFSENLDPNGSKFIDKSAITDFSDLFFNFLAILFGIILIYSIYYFDRLDKQVMDNKLSKNYDLVNATILETDVGKIIIGGHGKYEYIRFLPYVRYQYEYDENQYENDNFSYPNNIHYESNIKVKQILNQLQKKDLQIFVRRNDPNISYIKIDDEKIRADHDSNFSYSIFVCFLLFFIINCVYNFGYIILKNQV